MTVNTPVLKAYNWDAVTRNFRINPEPGKIIVKEFDYKGENAVVYQEKQISCGVANIGCGDAAQTRADTSGWVGVE